ncbi:MAG: hypothetical protein HYR96_07600 [Deltaproteobacteria bacterium]|nr:hypothetical protein [Deltaproteobacteria bacterium]
MPRKSVSSQPLQASLPTSSSSQWTGALEIRPSFLANSNQIYGQNYAELGVTLNAATYLGYQQMFMNNFQNSNPQFEDGPQLALSDGFFRLQLRNLWRRGGSSLSFEPRVYLPTDENLRFQGMISRLRLNTTFEQRFSRWFSLFVIEAPIIHFYDRAGANDPGTGAPSANPEYENRVILNSQFTFSKSWSLSIPFILQSVRYSNYQIGATNNDTWSNTVLAWPELTYSVNRNLQLGLAYQTGNLISSDMSQFTIDKGFAAGSAELVFHIGF